MVTDHAAAVVEGNAGQRASAVSDRPQHEAALDHLLGPGRDRARVAALVGLDPVSHDPQAADRSIRTVPEHLER